MTWAASRWTVASTALPEPEVPRPRSAGPSELPSVSYVMNSKRGERMADLVRFHDALICRESVGVSAR